MIVSLRGREHSVSPRKLMLAAALVVAGLAVSIAAITHVDGPRAFFDLAPHFDRAAVALGIQDSQVEQVAATREWVTGEVRVDNDSHFWASLDNILYGIFTVLIGLVGAALALLTAKKFFGKVREAAPGNEKMQEIAEAVREGAMAYLKRQRRVVLIALAATAVVITVVNLAGAHWWLSFFIFFGVLTGGACSFATGWFGMRTATMASNRTAWACKEGGLNAGLQVAFKAGAVMGLSVVGIGLAFVSIWFLLMAGVVDPIATDVNMNDVANAMITFGLGASLVALFARVGGGIFTKAADVGGDLVGKVEAGIPEDDPRNPATIADNVGDNVGDVAGMGADLYESYVGSILAAIALSWSASMALGRSPFAFVFAAVAIAGFGIVLSVVGTGQVKTKDGATLHELLGALHRGVNFASVGVAVVALVICMLAFGPGGFGMGIMMWLAVCVGLAAGLIIAWGSERYTAYDYKPTQSVAKQSVTGPATVIIGGLAVGMLSTWIPIITVAVATLLAFGFGGGFAEPAAGLYAVALAAVGMLSTLGITLATDAYGPIADNAGGNAEMAKLPPEVRERTDALDSLGNTTAAIGKGFAIGSAALTALALIASYQDSIRSLIAAKGDILFRGSNLGITSPAVIIGLFIGALLVFVFSALTMRAVGDAAKEMVEEVRRQFREIPGIMEGTGKPDYARCVDISTTAALRKMMVPSLIAVAGPIVTGVLFGAGAVFGLLAGGLAAGFAMAVMMANAGGAWDNAKKWVEKGGLAEAFIADGTYNPDVEDKDMAPVKADQGGPDGEGNGAEAAPAPKRKYAKYVKGSNEHKATVVGDTVGDPFKDTSGPSLNILIKLMSMVAIGTVALTMFVNDGNGLLPWIFEAIFTTSK